MKIHFFIVLLSLTFIQVKAQPSFPFFKDCMAVGDSIAQYQCNAEKFSAFKDLVHERVKAEQALFIEDRVVINFTLSPQNTINVTRVKANSAFLKRVCIEELELLANELQAVVPDGAYSFSLDFTLAEDLDYQNTNKEIQQTPYLGGARHFNQKGKIASFKYLFYQVQKELEQIGFKGEMDCDYYLKNGHLAGIDFNIPSTNPELNDQLFERFFKLYGDQVEYGSAKMGQNFKYHFAFNTYTDSLDAFRGGSFYLGLLDPVQEKEVTLRRIVDFGNSVYVQNHLKSSGYILELLRKKGLDTVKRFYYDKQWISVDSIRNYKPVSDVETGSERPPVLEGCDPEAREEEIQRCFQNTIGNYMSEFNYPPMARQMGLQGKIIVQFILGKDGAIYHIRVSEGVDPLIDMEAIRVVSIMPPAERPAMRNGEAVEMSFTTPFNLRLQ